MSECSTNPNTGEIYTCSDYNCPVHGDRNMEIAGFYSRCPICGAYAREGGCANRLRCMQELARRRNA